ncbi:universal stress protein [Haloarcula marina]|uniref:universal stress protein n=1 Tax=Haloarcula marina TaxID=2961574 RepID=UPI0020B85BF5|nr:universal stress protein [Halomicroarcula marina]
MYDHILVPTDGSDHAVAAAEYAASLAEVFDATLHLLTVVDVSAAAGPFSAGGVDDEYLDRLEREAESAIDALEPAVAGVDAVRSAVVRGTPSDAVLGYTDENDVDLVVMGTHGRRGLSRYVLGSVAERVVRRSAVPVLTIRAEGAGQSVTACEDILVPTDGSGEATAAVAHAVAIAARVGATVHAVSVVDLGDVATGAEMGVPPGLVQQLEENAEAAAAAVAEAAADVGVDAVTRVDVGHPANTLLEYVEDNEVDLVAMGTHGRTGLDRVLLGSTAERLVRRAPVPVLTVSTRGRTEGGGDGTAE